MTNDSGVTVVLPTEKTEVLAGTCSWPGCPNEAQLMAWNPKEGKVKGYCSGHVTDGAEEGLYHLGGIQGCPNCGCLFDSTF